MLISSLAVLGLRLGILVVQRAFVTVGIFKCIFLSEVMDGTGHTEDRTGFKFDLDIE